MSALSLEPYLKQWTDSDENASWLKDVLESKRGRLLMSVLSEMAVPKEDFSSIASLEGDVQAKLAFQHCLVSGQTLCIQNIRLLSNPVEAVSELPHDGWKSDAE